VPTEPVPHPAPARVVLLAGPSGCGKTYLAERTGIPILALDDFYRAGTDADMPRAADGTVDWEDPRSWDVDAACAALDELCRTGTVEVPTYSFGENRAVGHRTLDRAGSPVVIAEGIFAAELVDRLRAAGLLADALLIRQNRWGTFARRLARDLREGRKPPLFLVRQGWAKTASEPAVVRHLLDCGARPVSKPTARARLAALAAIAAAQPAGELEAPPRPAAGAA
jgi:uridine kinase